MQMRRFDFIKLTQRLDKSELTQQGFLKIPASLTRVGVFKYRKADGTMIRELRHPDDVFSEESLASLQMAPLTDDHPKEFVGPSNVKQLSIGWISEGIKLDGQLVNATVVVADKNGIEKVDSGKVELSCGYYADLIEESGTYDGEAYDLRQTNIRYNHVALVERGRAGPQVRLRTDSQDAEMVELEKNGQPLKEDLAMEKIKIDGKEFEVSKEIADAFSDFSKKMEDAVTSAKAGMVPKDDSDKAVGAEKEKADSLKKENDTLQAKVDHLEKEVKMKKDGLSREDITKAVKERKKIEDAAVAVLGSEAKLDEKSDLDLMKDIIMKDDADAKLDGKSEDYIRARFDGIQSSLGKRQDRASSLGVSFTDVRKADEFDSDAAREKAHADSKEEWKKPLATTKK